MILPCVGTPSKCVSNKLLFEVETKADIVVGKVINKGAANEHTQIGIKTTMVKIKISPNHHGNTKANFNRADFYHTHLQNLYYGYGETNWQDDIWKNISDIPDAIENLNIGTQVPDIFKISTVTTDNLTHTVLKMGDYKGRFDIDGRAMSLEAKGAVLQE